MTAIVARAPVRICDHGGWTDTWFGGPGRLVHFAVTPGVEVSIDRADGPDPVTLVVEDFEDRYAIVPGAPRPARHPLLESAVDLLPPPGDVPVEVRVRSAVPAGCGTGTSAAVTVALLRALAAARDERPSRRHLAYAAHRLEVDVVGAESGIQDHLAAAFGGINFIEMEHYPEASVHALPQWDGLDPCFSVVFLGRPHDSSAVHRAVIEAVSSQPSQAFESLRSAAEAARRAVVAQDLAALGRAMVANTDAQRRLHPSLVGLDAANVIGAARAHGAIGWKVNGAGGEGGSVTLLSATADGKQALDAAVVGLDARYEVLPVHLCPDGVQVRRGGGGHGVG